MDISGGFLFCELAVGRICRIQVEGWLDGDSTNRKLKTCEIYNVVIYIRNGLINVLADILEKIFRKYRGYTVYRLLVLCIRVLVSK
jgi:hypothetical protein